MILVLAVFVLISIYFLPLVMSAVIHSLPPGRLLGGSQSDRDFNTRARTVGAFLSGLADGISGYDPAKRRRYKTLGSFEKPFYFEGACAGLHMAKFMAPWRAHKNFDRFWNQHQRYIFLFTIGSGFASGMETFWTGAVAKGAQRSSKQIDPRLQQMFFDGYGFEKMIFHYLRQPAVLANGLAMEPTARLGFYEGVGRAFWFLKPDFSAFQAAVASLPTDCKAECYVGFGIATGFAGVERVAAGALSTYAPEILASADFQLGLIVGLFARYYTEPDFLKQLLGKEHIQLLHVVEEAAILFDELWQKNMSYQEWRSALKIQLGPLEIDPAFQLQAAPAMALGGA
jgi:Protein of unknown function (DUF1702)